MLLLDPTCLSHPTCLFVWLGKVKPWLSCLGVECSLSTELECRLAQESNFFLPRQPLIAGLQPYREAIGCRLAQEFPRPSKFFAHPEVLHVEYQGGGEEDGVDLTPAN